ncbi:hypothetical protein [Microlunatus sp. Gsoil 973]|uniref:hypothetical protein n=1 Tax=Microlunatus sp. Gsoil 973 TaxID=2672569 RepID=UPI0012B4F69C|nr:hypothetical protein [Microlunatus sp. Gsoil 973]QGN35160.1 hypothetical protein GJV80_22625 [Microlunatus sp. Gsoil 973]
MVGKKQGDYRPRRARADEGEAAETAQPSETATQPTTEDRIAASRRAERRAELQQLRDSVAASDVDRADRPDVGHRDNVAETAVPPHRRRRFVLGGVIALVLVAALTVGYLFWSDQRGTPSVQPPAPSATAPIDTSMVNDQAMLNPALAKSVIDQRWKITADQPAGTPDSPVPACLAEPQDDAPIPAEGVVRTLTTASNGPTALHLAEAYKSAELATESFALIAKSLGECNLKGSYIASARVITGLGDQATAVLLKDPAKNTYRAVVANRTGRLVNVVDIAQAKTEPDLDKAATALGRLTDRQCTAAIGVCASNPHIADGPPPVAGDEPGFLALADIPVPTSHTGTWGGLSPGSPADVVTSGCENVDFNTISADSRAARSYILVDKPKGMPETFGLDQITLTMKSDKAASDEADLITKNLKNCSDRLPTADVNDLSTVSGTGADDTAISGSVALVSQKISANKTSKYRVGIVAAGNKLVYTFLPRTPDWDLTQDQWETLTVRAAQRATQVR